VENLGFGAPGLFRSIADRGNSKHFDSEEGMSNRVILELVLWNPYEAPKTLVDKTLVTCTIMGKPVERNFSMPSQRDTLRRLAKSFGMNEDRVVPEYAAAERRGEVKRRSNTYGINSALQIHRPPTKPSLNCC
jgi:hypothetical protein